MVFETKYLIIVLFFKNFNSNLKSNEQLGAQNSSPVNRMSEKPSQSIAMSSDNNLVLKSVSKNSHSFDDRICDDLSEVLLQFLPLEVKQRLECVSKQFQRTVFQKQFSINLYSSLESNEKMSQLTEEQTFKMFYTKSIESLLNKCPNIQKMFIFVENNRIFKSILPLITKYCYNLNEFNVSLDDRSEPELNEEFLRFFGQKLKYIWCGEDLDFNLFPNLHSLNKYFMFYSPFTHQLPGNVLSLNLFNLKELNITLTEENYQLFREVLQKFHKIRHLALNVRTYNQKSVSNAFNESPVLLNLIKLKYNTKIGQNGNQFLDSLTQLATKFPKLKSFEIGSLAVKIISNLSELLSPLKAFSDLKRMDLMLNFSKEDYHDDISLKPFEELSNITHLTLDFINKRLNEKILTDIDIYLPKLQVLVIFREIITDEEGVTQMAESLSRLSYLQTIYFGLTNEYNCNIMRAKIAEKCRRIRNILIHNIHD